MVEHIIKTEDLVPDFETVGNLKDCHLIYHDAGDTLFVRSESPSPATSFDLNGEVWIRILPESGEIVGLEIDDFESVFLKKYPELANAWAEIKPRCIRKKTETHIENRESFIVIILNFVRQLFNENPLQISFGTTSTSPLSISSM
jgi:hypothetical protein